MKRSPMPPRRSPMKRGTINARGRKAMREQEALVAFRQTLAFRSQGMCEGSTPACPPCPHRGVHAHHIAPSDRDRGVHLPDRGLWLCAPAHSYIHRHPAESYEAGWLLKAAS